MHRIIYLSQATAPFGSAQLQTLLAHARTTNARHGITGVLLYDQSQFFQVLEGEEIVVRKRYTCICQDPRHCDITTFADHAITTRAFPDWHMAFNPLPPQQLIEFTGYNSSDYLGLEYTILSKMETQLLQLLQLPHASTTL